MYFSNEEVKKYIPVEDTQEIYIFGEVIVNKRILEFFTQKEIILHYFNYYGYYIGSYYPRDHLNSGYMIVKQAVASNHETQRLELATLFVLGSLKNIVRVLKYYISRGKSLDKQLQKIESIIVAISEQNTPAKLMAKEGEARQHYYKCFDKILDKPAFSFEKRTRRPPQNKLNTLISFLNSLLYVTVLSEIYHTHLDARIGFLHEANFRRFSLNLDVAEIFKPIIVDRAIFKLIGKNMVTEKHFDKQMDGILLNEKGRAVVVTEYENRLKETLKVRDIGKSVSYRRLIRLELYKLEKHLMGEKKYEPYISRW